MSSPSGSRTDPDADRSSRAAASNRATSTAEEPSESPAPTGALPRLIARVMATKPVRVMLHYGASRGPVLASGLAYQGLFATFAGLWVGFSIAGLVIQGDLGLRQSLVDTLAQAVPGLIDDGSGSGAVEPEQLLDTGVFGWTGAVALIGLLVTALGWLASARDSVRLIFGLPPLAANIVLLKLKDLGLAVAFGLAIVVSSLLSVVGTAATGAVLDATGIGSDSVTGAVVGRAVTLGVMFALDAVVLAALYRVLSGLRIPWARLRSGALLGAAGLGVLKVLGSALLGGASSNPLLASFAVILGLLVFFNFVCQVILIAASWIAVGIADSDYVLDEAVQRERMREAQDLLESQGLAVGRPVRRWGRRTRIERTRGDGPVG